MTASIADLIRQQCRPLAPIATGEEPVLQQLTGIRAVMFDVYGTLLISSSGDIDASEASAKGEAFEQALAAVGLELRHEWRLRRRTAHAGDRGRACPGPPTGNRVPGGGHPGDLAPIAGPNGRG